MTLSIDYALDRLSENSTWRGIIAIATAGGVAIQPDLANAIIALGMAAIGLINVLRKEKKQPTVAPETPQTKG